MKIDIGELRPSATPNPQVGDVYLDADLIALVIYRIEERDYHPWNKYYAFLVDREGLVYDSSCYTEDFFQERVSLGFVKEIAEGLSFSITPKKVKE